VTISSWQGQNWGKKRDCDTLFVTSNLFYYRMTRRQYKSDAWNKGMVRPISSLYPRDGNRANLCMTTALMKSLGLSVFPDHVVAMMALTQLTQRLVLTFQRWSAHLRIWHSLIALVTHSLRRIDWSPALVRKELLHLAYTILGRYEAWTGWMKTL